MKKSDFQKIIGNNVRKYRERYDLTQEQFAEKAGISTSFCGAIETGRKAPSMYTMWKIADNLGVTVDFFIYENAASEEIASIVARLLDGDALYLRYIRNLIEVTEEYCKELNRNCNTGLRKGLEEERHGKKIPDLD